MTQKKVFCRVQFGSLEEFYQGSLTEGEPNLDNPEGDNDDETVAPETGAISKKTPGKVHFEEAKVTKQQPLPPTVEKGPGKVIPEKQKPAVESGSDSDSNFWFICFISFILFPKSPA